MRRYHGRTTPEGSAGRLVAAVLVLAGFLACPAATSAQFRAAIQGTVQDSTGKVLPRVRVIVTNNETGRTDETVTSERGVYYVAGLAPGTYGVTARLAGSKTAVADSVVVHAETARAVNFVLEPGDAAETITAPTGVTLLWTGSASVAGTFSALEIQRLPQFGRDPYELVRLAPGVFGNGARTATGLASSLPNVTGPGGSSMSIFETENQVQVSANGQRVSANSFIIDGVSVNSLGIGGAAVVTPNQESVEAITVVASSYSAEDGRNSGALVKVVSRSGTNTLRGSALVTWNDPVLNARNAQSGRDNAPRVKVDQRARHYGGSLGGPILSDRLFFFGSFAGLRVDLSTLAHAWVETPEYRELVQRLRPSGVSASILGASGIEPRVRALLAVDCGGAPRCQVVPGGLDIGSPTGSLGSRTEHAGDLDGIPDIQFARIALPGVLRGEQYNARLDYQQGRSRFALSLYVTQRNDRSSDPLAVGRPAADMIFKPLSSLATFTYNRILSPTLLNEARLNFTGLSADPVDSSNDSDFGIPRVEVGGMPFGRIGFSFGGPWERPSAIGSFSQRTYEVRNVVTKVLGNHVVKIGAEVRWEQNNSNMVERARPGYLFSGLFDLANDAPYGAVIDADPLTGSPADLARQFRTSYYGGFVQNDWTPQPGLVLNFGLRYEYFTPLGEKDGRLNNLEVGPHGLVDSRMVSVERMHDPDRNNFAPRVGVAWSPQRFSNKLVLRGGFGVSYNRTPNTLFSNARRNPPFSVRYFEGVRYVRGDSRSPFSFPPNTVTVEGNDSTWTVIWGAPPKLPNAYVYRYSADAQYQLAPRLVASIGYTGSASRKLIRIVNQNLLFDEPNPAFDAVFFPTPDAEAHYNAVGFRLAHEFADGFSLEGSYRLGRSVDMVSYEGPGLSGDDPGAAATWTNPKNPKSEKGPSDYDVRHGFVLTGVWDLPIAKGRSGAIGSLAAGWQTSGILTVHSGFPWSPKSAEQDNTPGLSYERPSGQFRGGTPDPTDPAGPADARNSQRGSRYLSLDMTFGKRTPLGDRARLELRVNCFNLLNTLNLMPFGFLNEGTFVESVNFGRVDGALAGRVVELQARVSF